MGAVRPGGRPVAAGFETHKTPAPGRVGSGRPKKKQNPKQKDTRTPKLKEKNHANPPQPAVNPLKNPMAPRYESLLPRKVRYNVIQFDLKPFETDRIIEKSLWFFRKIQENPGKPSKTQ